MLCLLVGFLAMFVWSAHRRWQLLATGRPENRLDHIKQRIEAVWRYAFVQEKMDYYQPAGLAHKLIFAGFVLLLFRILMLWGRGFSPTFSFFVLGMNQPLGAVYEFIKDVITTGVLCGVAVFFYYRVLNPLKRITRHWEGTLILGIIAAMMLGDMFYDGAAFALGDRAPYLCGPEWKGTAYATAELCSKIAVLVAPQKGAMVHAHFSFWPSPAGSFVAGILHDLPPGVLLVISKTGFWLHAGLPLVFLNLLPYSKHFHVITAIPNVFLKNMEHPGRLRPMAENAEKLMEVVGAAAESPDPASLPVGVGRIEHFSWKAILDFYTCTECGRCSDNCPAHKTGKILSYDASGKGSVVAEGVPGRYLLAAPGGGFYVTGHGEKHGDSGLVWFVKDGKKTVVDSGLKLSTGLAYRPDQWLLSVADGHSKWAYSYQINPDGTLTNKERFFWLHVPDWEDDAGAEEVCYSQENQMFVATRWGVQVCTDDGPTQVILPLPDRSRVLGVCLGGRELDTLYAFSGDKIWKRKVKSHTLGAFTPWMKANGGKL